MSALTADDVWRDNVVKGDIHSGANEPDKADVRRWGRGVETRIGAGVTRRTAALLATVVPAADTYPLGAVTLDSDPTKNGFWSWSGSAWQFDRPFPDTWGVLTGLGGTANAVTASSRTGVDPANVAVFLIQPALTNDDDVTVSIDGGAAKPVRDVNGAELAPGLWTSGRIIQFVDNGDEYRLVSDPDADGAAAAAAASALAGANSAAASNAARILAEAAAAASGEGVAPVSSRVVLANLDFTIKTAAMLKEVGREGGFAWIAADLSTEVAADPMQGLYVAPAIDITGTSGAWVRVFDGANVLASWFGATGAGDGTLDGSPDEGPQLQAAFDTGLDVDLGHPPSGFYRTNQQLVLTEREQGIVGHGHFGDCTIFAGAAVSSVLEFNSRWQRGFNFSVAGGPDEAHTFTVTIANPAVFTKAGHGFVGGERIRLNNAGGALPTGLNKNTHYFVLFVDANTFGLSLTNGGSAIITTGVQSGVHAYRRAFATHAITYRNAGRTSLRHMDILYAIEDGVNFIEGSNISSEIVHNTIRANGRDGINIFREGVGEGDNGNITRIVGNDISQNVRNGAYDNTMGVVFDGNSFESNNQGGSGYGLYVEPSDRGFTHVMPMIGHNWFETVGGASRDVYGLGARLMKQTGLIEARTINGAPIPGNISRNITLRQAQEGLTSFALAGDAWFCDQWLFKPAGASGNIGRVDPTSTPFSRSFFGGAPYVIDLDVTNFNAGIIEFGQRWRDVATLEGHGITVSLWATSPGNDEVATISVTQNFGSGGSAPHNESKNIVLRGAEAGEPTHVNFVLPTTDGMTIGADSFLEVKLRLPSTLATGQYYLTGLDVRPGMTPPPAMDVPPLAREIADCERYLWAPTEALRWQGNATSGVTYSTQITIPRMVATPNWTLAGVTQTNFAAGAPSEEDPGPCGIAAVKAANGTGAGFFRFTAKADARI